MNYTSSRAVATIDKRADTRGYRPVNRYTDVIVMSFACVLLYALEQINLKINYTPYKHTVA